MLIIISVVTCDHRDLEPLNRYAVTTPFLISSLWLTCVSHNIFHIGVFALCGLLFVHVILFSSIFFWPLCSLLFCDLRLMVTPLVFSNLWYGLSFYYNAITLMRYNITLKFTANPIFNIDEIFHFKNDSCIEIIIEYTT